MRRLEPGRTRRRARGSRVLLALLLLLVLALGELALIILVGRQLGVLPTVLLVVVMSALGVWLLRREGGRTWRALRTAGRSGSMPSRQIADAILVLVGGVLLVLPGFLSDLVGLVLVLPLTRPLARPLLEAAVARRVFHDLGVVRVQRTGPTPDQAGPARGPADVVEGEIVD